MLPGLKIRFRRLIIMFPGLNITLQSLIEFLGLQILLATLTKLRVIRSIRDLERILIGGIIRLRELICRRGTGVMMGGRTIKRLIGSRNSQRDHHHQKPGGSPNNQNHHLLMLLACTTEKQLQPLSLRKHFPDQSQIQN